MEAMARRGRILSTIEGSMAVAGVECGSGVPEPLPFGQD
jgi:hypothetical protein